MTYRNMGGNMIREFEKYKYLGIATARKYYSHYFMKWEEEKNTTAAKKMRCFYGGITLEDIGN